MIRMEGMFVIFITMGLFQQSLCDFKLTVLHTNDMHSRFEDADAAAYNCKSGCFGGFARLKTAVDVARKEAEEKGRQSIFLNAGDTFQGSIFFITFGWTVVVTMLQTLGLDVISLGNHEFDGTTKDLAKFLEAIKIPVVCSNIDTSEEQVLKSVQDQGALTPSKVLEVGPDRVKVGIIGYLTYNETENLGNVKLFPEVESIQKEAARLKQEGINILIALGHAGYNIDKEIARLVPDIDIVVGGHTNTFLYNGTQPEVEVPEGPYPTIVEGVKGRKVLVVQANAYTKYLGKLEVTFNDEGEIVDGETSGNPILITGDVYKKDPVVVHALEPFWDKLKAINATRTIGHTKVFLEGDLLCRERECTLGNLVTDAFVYANARLHKGPGWTDAPLAFIMGATMKANIDTAKYGDDDITYMQLASVLTRTNSLVKLTLDGTTLLQVLEVSASLLDDPSAIEPSKQFLQYSGIRVLYDRSRPPGQRVLSASARCGNCTVPMFEEIKPAELYNVIGIKYMTDGNEGFTMLRGNVKKQVIDPLLIKNERDAVENYLSRVSLVYPTIEGRILFSTADNHTLPRPS